MTKKPVYAFIDSQNLNLSVREMGWTLDFTRFRTYLKDKYGVTKAHLFLGYIPENDDLYENLKKAGFICIFRPTLTSKDGHTKGNCDAELVLHTMLELPNYHKAIIVSGDGDFQCLVQYLAASDRLAAIIVPNQKKYSALLKTAELKPHLKFISDLRRKLEYKPKKKNLRKD